MLHIPSTAAINDSSYRYQMPRMQLRIEGKGGDTKTNILNLQQIAKSLAINQNYILNPKYILKFFGFQKGSSVTFKPTKEDPSKVNYIIRGKFQDNELLQALDKFIQKYVLCPKCQLPEMIMEIKNGKIFGLCCACSFDGQLDNTHRLTAFILKNPSQSKQDLIKRPNHELNKQNYSKQQLEGKLEEKKEKTEKSAQQKGENTCDETKQNENSQKSQETRQQLLIRKVQQVKSFMEERADKVKDIMAAETIQFIKSFKLSKAQISYIVFTSIFTINIAKQLPQKGQLYKDLMGRLFKNSNVSQFYTLMNLEYLFFQESQKDLSTYLPTIMNMLLQQDIFSSRFIIDWSNDKIEDIEKQLQADCFLYNEKTNKKVLELAEDFIDYLKDQSKDESHQECQIQTIQSCS